MKTTLEVDDGLFRRAKALAARRGETLKQFFTEALEEKLRRSGTNQSAPWMAGFGGLADLADENRRVMALIEEEFETIEPESVV